MSFKTTAGRIGNALIEVANEMHNSRVRAEIDQIDQEQAALVAAVARLEESRTEKTRSLI